MRSQLPPAERRDYAINCRLNEAEDKALDRVAKFYGVTPAQAVRRLIVETASAIDGKGQA